MASDSTAAARREQNAPQEIDLVEVYYRLLDQWKLILIIALLCAAIMAVITKFLIVPKYVATSKIYVLTSSDSVVNLSDLQLGTYLASDYQEVFATREVNEQVISNLGLPYTFEDLLKMVKITNPPSTRILGITVTSTDAAEVADIANEFANVASDYVVSVMQTDRPTSLSVAVPPAKPSSPSMVKNVLLGGLGGALLVCLIIAISTVTDDRIKSADDLVDLTGVPVFAQIPMTNFEEKAIATAQKPGSASQTDNKEVRK